MTYQKFLQYKEPDNYIFFNSKNTSPFTFNSEYLIDHTKTKGKLRIMTRRNKVFSSFQMITQRDQSLYHKNTSF